MDKDTRRLLSEGCQALSDRPRLGEELFKVGRDWQLCGECRNPYQVSYESSGFLKCAYAQARVVAEPQSFLLVTQAFRCQTKVSYPEDSYAARPELTCFCRWIPGGHWQTPFGRSFVLQLDNLQPLLNFHLP